MEVPVELPACNYDRCGFDCVEFLPRMHEYEKFYPICLEFLPCSVFLLLMAAKVSGSTCALDIILLFRAKCSGSSISVLYYPRSMMAEFLELARVIIEKRESAKSTTFRLNEHQCNRH